MVGRLTSRIWCVVFASFCIGIVWFFVYSPSLAQTGDDWSEILQLSDEATFAQGPALTVDRAGRVHAFWSSKPSGYPDTRFAIAYSTIVFGEWLPPQEIMLSPDNRDASIPHIVVDLENNLNLFWVTSGLVGDLYYSWAPASQAYSAKAWSAPALIRENVYQHDVVIDSDGNMHLVYASQSQGICHVEIDAQGGNWSEPICLPSCVVLRDEEFDTRPQLAMDSHGGLHVVWLISDYSAESLLAYAGRAVCYANSLDGGLSWTAPIIIDEVESREPSSRSQPEFAIVAVDTQDRVHIAWIGQSMYRYHIFSTDFGATWTQPQIAIPVGGYNNWMQLAADTDGGLHFVTASLDGLLYNYWDGTRWGEYKVFPNTRGAHYADASLTPDGTLHAVWQDHGGGQATQGHILYLSLSSNEDPVIDPDIDYIVPSAAGDMEKVQPGQSVIISTPVIPTENMSHSKYDIPFLDQFAESTMWPIGLSLLMTGLVILVALYSSRRWRQ